MVRILQVAAAAALATAVAAQPSAKAAKGKAPILTSAIIYDTAELAYDVSNRAYSIVAADAVAKAKAAIAPSLPKDPVAEACKLAGVDQKIVWDAYNKAQGTILHAKAIVSEQTAKLEAPLLSLIDIIVDRFDKALPKHAGAIPRGSLADFTVCIVFLNIALYLAYRIFRTALKIALSILCIFCCCGCCCLRRSKSPAKAAAVSKGKAAAATTAAAKGAAKQAAKAANKK